MHNDIALIEELTVNALKLIMKASFKYESGRREPAYNILKWWGRRFAALSRGLLASLILRPDEEELLEKVVLNKEVPRTLIRRAKERLVVDPFVGGGTILIEALRLGFNVYGIDINPAAVEVTKATLDLLTPKCSKIVNCLIRSLKESATKMQRLWTPKPGFKIIHIFLVKCNEAEDYCHIPVLLKVNKRPKPKCTIITKEGLVKIDEGPCNYKPTYPLLKISKSMLPHVILSYRAYAVEILDNRGNREFQTLFHPDNRALAEWVEKTSREALTYINACTPVPELRETRRLHSAGVNCWEQLYTPRQLASLREFINTAEKMGCEKWARLLVASATRTLSLLAFYYQPYGRVNPGLVIKSYWLPKYPIELNPFSYIIKEEKLKSIGRGTLASYINAAWRICCHQEISAGKVLGLRAGRAEDLKNYPSSFDYVVTDPPYPNMQRYEDLSLIYRYWIDSDNLAHIGNSNNTELTKTIIEASKTIMKKLKSGGYYVLLLGASTGFTEALATTLIEISRLGYGLRRLYWIPGEAPGKLGRSRSRGVYIAVYRLGTPSRSDALDPLERIKEIAAYAISLLGRNDYLDVSMETLRAEKLANTIRSSLNF